MRTLDAALIAELGLTITRPGYLVEIGWSSVVRLSTLGDLSYGGHTWTAGDVRVSGLARTESGGQGGQLSIGNALLDFGAVWADEGVADIPISIYAVWAGVPGYAQLEFAGIGDDSELVGSRLAIRLAADARRYAYSPRRWISAEAGFNTLLPAGTQIGIGGQTYLLERA